MGNAKSMDSADDKDQDEVCPYFFKLNFNCFKIVFEWLSLTELCSLRQTCRMMKPVVDYYIRSNYPLVFQTLTIDDTRLKTICDAEIIGFDYLNHISFFGCKLTPEGISSITALLGRIESIQIATDQIEGDFHNDFLKLCTRLKHLYVFIRHSGRTVEEGNGWLKQHYPSLQHISLNVAMIRGSGIHNVDLTTFLERNSNIRFFTTTFRVLWYIRDSILGSKITLDQLNIGNFCYFDPSVAALDPHRSLYTFLNALHEQGLYQSLHVHTNIMDEFVQFPHICSLHALKKLSMGYNMILSNYRLVNFNPVTSPLHSVKELFLGKLLRTQSLEILANNVIDVNRVVIEEARIGQFLPFIRCCAQLQQIKINCLIQGTYFKHGIIDLFTLNNERRTLAEAREVFIFVDEGIFLRNKRINKIDTSLIKLRRAQAWKEDYRYI